MSVLACVHVLLQTRMYTLWCLFVRQRPQLFLLSPLERLDCGWCLLELSRLGGSLYGLLLLLGGPAALMQDTPSHASCHCCHCPSMCIFFCRGDRPSDPRVCQPVSAASSSRTVFLCVFVLHLHSRHVFPCCLWNVCWLWVARASAANTCVWSRLCRDPQAMSCMMLCVTRKVSPGGGGEGEDAGGKAGRGGRECVRMILPSSPSGGG